MKIKKYKVILLLIILITSLSAPLQKTLAEDNSSTENDPIFYDILDQTVDFSKSAGIYKDDPKTPQDITISIIEIVLGLLGLGFLILIIVSGIQWMTSGGNEEKVTKARKNIINAVIGLGIVLTAYIISNFIFESIQKATEVEYNFW